MSTLSSCYTHIHAQKYDSDYLIFWKTEKKTRVLLLVGSSATG